MRRPALLALLPLAALLAAPVTAGEIDPFYADLERSARAARTRGDEAEAAKLFRVACFGMLEAPERLAACLVRLAGAQAALGDRAEFESTFRRLAALEERFRPLDRAPIAAEERAGFLRAAAELLEPELWSLAPGLADEIAGAHAALAAAASPPAGRRRRQPEPSPPAESSGGGEAPGGSAPLEQPGAADELGLEDLQTIDSARAQLGGAPDLARVAETLERLLPIADRRPEDRDLNELAARLAYRASRWPECARHFRRAGEPGLDRPLDRFYLAVCLYESGERSAAADLLAPTADALQRTPFVDRYRRLILGEAGGSAP